jgi:hypothetical protein
MKFLFVDTLLGRVHGMDRNRKDQPASNPFNFIAGNIKELGYGG